MCIWSCEQSRVGGPQLGLAKRGVLLSLQLLLYLLLHAQVLSLWVLLICASTHFTCQKYRAALAHGLTHF